MRRYLVVSNQTLSSEAFEETIRSCLATGSSRFHVVVPATHARDQLTWTEGHDRAIAEERLERALELLADLGAQADGEVGDASPLRAMQHAVGASGPFDQAVLFTLPPGLSRWLRQDLPHRARRRLGIPVTHVVAEPATA